MGVLTYYGQEEFVKEDFTEILEPVGEDEEVLGEVSVVQVGVGVAAGRLVHY